MKKLWIALGIAMGLGLGSEAMAQSVELDGNARFQLQTGLMKVSASGGKRRTSSPAVFLELRDQTQAQECPRALPRIHTPALEIYLPAAWQTGVLTLPECRETVPGFIPTTCIDILGVSQSGNDFTLSLDEERIQEITTQIGLFLLGDAALGASTTVNEVVSEGKLLAEGNRSRYKLQVKATVSGGTLAKDSKVAWGFTLNGDRIATELCDITTP